MELIREKIDTSSLQGLELLPKNTFFVDIETLGFSAAYQPIYMIGTAQVLTDETEITLYFARTPSEEKEILIAFLSAVPQNATLFTYNGNMFDIPYIKKRAAKYGITDALAGADSLDLFLSVKRKKDLLGLSRCKQKDVEAFLNVNREDTMTGGELIAVYQRYAKAPTESDHKLLITHNLEDVKGMLLLVPMLAYEKLPDAGLSELRTEIEASGEHIFVYATLSVSLPRELRLRTEDAYVIISGNRVKCALHLKDGRVRYYYDDPKNYVYLINEGTVIPKKLAASVAKDAKRAAKPGECYSLVDVTHTAQPQELYLKLLRHILQSSFA